ncbi:phosphohistidine phosphatase SixA [Cyclobacteriaceae bacterium YHN15]|jgi:phosphohistidine phosphatase|nr:phosphohistidine phosphatase SixA [Cyclobacteriaceae bacterium YHN15]
MENQKTLFLLRHAEAEFVTGPGGDISRELSIRGQSQISRLAKLLKKNQIEFDSVLSSNAKRTQQSTEIVTQWVSAKKIHFLMELYEADPHQMLSIINQVGWEVDNLLVVGHNPTISALVSYLTEQEFISLQPGMIAKIEIHTGNWNEVGRGTGTLLEILQ